MSSKSWWFALNVRVAGWRMHWLKLLQLPGRVIVWWNRFSFRRSLLQAVLTTVHYSAVDNTVNYYTEKEFGLFKHKFQLLYNSANSGVVVNINCPSTSRKYHSVNWNTVRTPPIRELFDKSCRSPIPKLLYNDYSKRWYVLPFRHFMQLGMKILNCYRCEPTLSCSLILVHLILDD